MSQKQESQRQPYTKPALVKIQNLKEITFECPDFECSIGGINDLPVPPAG